MNEDKTTRLTIYVPETLKEKLTRLAKEAKPPTSKTRLALYLIELGLREYLEEAAVERREKHLQDYGEKQKQAS